MVKNPPAKQKTQIWSLDQRDPLKKGMANHSSVLAWKNPMDREAWQATVYRVSKSQTWLSDWTHTHTHTQNIYGGLQSSSRLGVCLGESDMVSSLRYLDGPCPSLPPSSDSYPLPILSAWNPVHSSHGMSLISPYPLPTQHLSLRSYLFWMTSTPLFNK